QAIYPINQIELHHLPAGSTRRVRSRIESIWSERALASTCACAMLSQRKLTPTPACRVWTKKQIRR
ncbi:MAG: hypothetical protein K0U74_06090, partial [Alphaproteobacteria bacterium]|nr:hypothetical protein [Alphaproteobacteria bacterium]